MRIASSRYQDAITKNNSKRRSLIKPYLPFISFMETAGNHHTSSQLSSFCGLVDLLPLLTNQDLLILDEGVRRDLHVEGSRTNPNTAAEIVVRAVARAEPAIELTGPTQRHASQVGANAHQHHPLLFASPLNICLGIPELAHADGVRSFNLLLCAPTDKDGLPTPLDGDSFSHLHGAQFHLHAGQRQHVCRSRHRGDKLNQS
mmetsp:Transcript_31928/g.50109  ORF Transcript_31928/g.50109 Transcript_31928/m.50109 type:complete len:202 (-) Transcript_31928:338-943(-)